MRKRIIINVTTRSMEQTEVEKLVKKAVLADLELGATQVTISRAEVNDAEAPQAPTQETLLQSRVYRGRVKGNR